MKSSSSSSSTPSTTVGPLRLLPLTMSFALSLSLSACGGGGSDAATTASPATGTGSVTTLPSQYIVYARGQGLAVAGAGVAPAGQLELASGTRTQLAFVGNDGGLSASNINYRVVSRLDGAVLMLCDPAGFTAGADPTRYVAIGTQGGAAAAVQVTRATELAGLRFYRLRGCSLVDHQDVPQGRTDNPDAQTRSYSVQGDGSLTSSSGGALSVAQFRDIVSGGSLNFGDGPEWLTVYRFSVDGQTRHFAVSRFVPSPSGAPQLALWLPQ